MSDQKGLQRIICIDGHIAGKVMEIRVKEHANLSGTNGAGKTTLLKLIPFFYGATPSQIVQRAGKRKSFVDYYLPRTTSLLIFEYKSARDVFCVVVYRHSSGDKPAYRFLGERFDIGYFSEEASNAALFHEGKNLGSHWTKLRLEHSKQLERVTDYRGVIQGDRSLINSSGKSRELSKLVAMYSLTGKFGEMKHMDKLSNAILGRSGDMKRIKEMLADIMREEGVELPTIKPHKDMKSTIAELRTLRELEGYVDLFKQTISSGVLYFENTERLNELHAELSLFLESVLTDAGNADDALARIESEQKTIKADWENKRDFTEASISTAKVDKQAADTRLDRLLKEKGKWEAADIEKKRSRYDQVDSYFQTYNVAKERLESLSNSLKEIEATYEHKRSELNERYAKAKDTLNLKKEKAKDSAHLQETGLKDIELKILHAEVKEKDEIKGQKQVEIDGFKNKISILEHQVQQVPYADEEKLNLEKAELERDKADEGHQCAQQLFNQFNAELGKQKQVLDEKLSASEDARLIFNKESEKFEEINKRCKPKAGTWLAQLRLKQPDWHESIGRIVREDVINHAGLSPTFLGLNNEEKTVLGWKLDAHKLDKPQWAASEDVMLHRLEIQEDKVRLAGEHRKRCEGDAEKAKKDWDDAQKSLDEKKRSVIQTEIKKKSSVEAVRQVKQKNHDGIMDRKNQAKKECERQKRKLSLVEQSLKDDLERLSIRTRERLQEELSGVSIEVNRLEEVIENIGFEIEAAKSTLNKNLSDLDDDLKAMRSEQGVDDAIWTSAKKECENAKVEHEEVAGLRDEVYDYKQWLDNEWSQHQRYREDLSQKTQVYDQQVSELEELRRVYKISRDELNANKGLLQKKLIELRTHKESVKELLGRLIKPVKPVAIEQCRPFEMITIDARTVIESREKLLTGIKEGVDKADSIISRGGESNQIAVAWRQLREEKRNQLTDITDQTNLSVNLTLALEELLNVHLPQNRNLLSAFVENLGGQLMGFFDGLKAVEKAISSQSRTISKSISLNIHFDAISDIRVALISRISSQDYWPQLEEFSYAWQSWKSSGKSGLPPEDLDTHILNSCEILYRSNMEKGIESVFDLEISLRQNDQLVTVTRGVDLENVSSTGLSYLILCSIFAGLTRMLCPNRGISLHWPMDELGTLASENISRLFALLNANNIVMVGGFPTTDPLLLQHFKHHHEIKKGYGLIELVLSEDKLSRIIRERREQGSLGSVV